MFDQPRKQMKNNINMKFKWKNSVFLCFVVWSKNNARGTNFFTKNLQFADVMSGYS